jgi:alkanesulfonate monooxygenase SsuD/methylene tetrahydromethanopterin reductase-like flavin-dependent oxidoreductase (luciferase family)
VSRGGANDYRHPVLLTKEAATLDLLSGGPVELGLGAGRPSAAGDHQMLGLPFDSAGVRVARLAESVALLKRLLAGETVSAQGPFYTVDRARSAPAPVQRPLPLLVAGSGQRLLRLAARDADIIALGIAPQETEAGTAEKVGWLRAASGERFAPVELNINLVGVGGHLARYVAAQAGAVPAVQHARDAPGGRRGG